MFSRDSRRERRSDRPRRRPERIAVEGLETRQLMAYSPLGFSLPDLSVTGLRGADGRLGRAADGRRQRPEPGRQLAGRADSTCAPGADQHRPTPPADDASQVFASTAAQRRRPGSVLIGTITIPAIRRTATTRSISTITLPARPAGLPGNGGKIYLTFVVNNDQAILESRLHQQRLPGPAARSRSPTRCPTSRSSRFDVPRRSSRAT